MSKPSTASSLHGSEGTSFGCTNTAAFSSTHKPDANDKTEIFTEIFLDSDNRFSVTEPEKTETRVQSI